MNIDPYLKQAIALTQENPDFLAMSMNDFDFAKLVKKAHQLKADILAEFGDAGLEALCDALAENDDWEETLDFFEAIFFDD